MRISSGGGVSIGTATGAGANNLLVNGSVTGSSFSGSGSGLTGTASSLSIGGNAATASNAATATNPASGGSFITSSNIGSQSVNFATTAGNGGVTSLNGQTGAITNTGVNVIGSYYAGASLTYGNYTPSTTVAGSSLRSNDQDSGPFIYFTSGGYNPGLSGTYRAMSNSRSFNDKGNNFYGPNLWVRIS
jgi:hypothetical protein